MRYVKLTNRLDTPLEGIWDGQRHTIPPGESNWPEAQAAKFRAQNPIMGTRDPYNYSQDHYIAIAEFGQDCTPVKLSQATQYINLDTLKAAGIDHVVVPVDGLYRLRPAEAASRQSAGTGQVASEFTDASV